MRLKKYAPIVICACMLLAMIYYIAAATDGFGYRRATIYLRDSDITVSRIAREGDYLIFLEDLWDGYSICYSMPLSGRSALRLLDIGESDSFSLQHDDNLYELLFACEADISFAYGMRQELLDMREPIWYGVYISRHNISEEYQHIIVLEEDGTFLWRANAFESMEDIRGEYQTVDDIAELRFTAPESPHFYSPVFLRLEKDGTLVFLSERGGTLAAGDVLLKKEG